MPTCLLPTLRIYLGQVMNDDLQTKCEALELALTANYCECTVEG